jgi:hypothetical protein
MRTTGKLVIGGTIGLVVYWLVNRYQALKSLVFAPGAVTGFDMLSGNGAGGLMPVVYFTVVVQNTGGSDLLVNSFAGNLYSNDTLVGNVSNFSRVPIVANAATQIPVAAELRLLGIVDELIQAFQTKNLQKNLKLVGSININGVPVPVSLDYTVGL